MKIGIFFVIVCFLFSPQAKAWGPNTHRILILEALEPVAASLNLHQTIERSSFEKFLQKLSQENPSIQTKEDFARWLKINPQAPFDRPHKEEQNRKETTPLVILSLYAQKPDDGRDRHLAYDPTEQFWFGSGIKMASQAFRHLEKPPFDLFHPLNTFGFPLGKVGQASGRAEIYFDLALLSFKKLKEPYWGWHFLGCAFHYLEDLQNPYHSMQLQIPLLLEGYRAYQKWGKKSKRGFIGTTSHIVSNLHHYFESFADFILTLEDSEGPNDLKAVRKMWFASLKESPESFDFSSSSSISQMAKKIRNFSNRYAFESVAATLKLTGEKVTGPQTYDIGEESYLPEDPELFYTDNAMEREEAVSKIAEIISLNFRYQGTVIREVVRRFLEETSRP